MNEKPIGFDSDARWGNSALAGHGVNSPAMMEARAAAAPALCTYHAFYRGSRLELTATSSRAAQIKAAAYFDARKAYQVSIILVGRPDGSAVVHSTSSL